MKLTKQNNIKSVPLSKESPSDICRPTSNSSRVFAVSLLTLAFNFILSPPEAFALDAGGEMGASTQRLDALLNGNIMHVVMGAGIASSVIFSFYKSSFVPVGVGIGAGVLYGFARTWINATFAMCI